MRGNLLPEEMPQSDHGGCIIVGDIEACSLKALIVCIDEHAAVKGAVGVPLGIVHAGVEFPDR